MSQQRVWWSAAFVVVLCLTPYAAASAKDSGAVPGAVQDAKDEDSKAARITLKNTIRRSPQDPVLHAKIAKLYFQLGDAAPAEHETMRLQPRHGRRAVSSPTPFLFPGRRQSSRGCLQAF